MGNGAFTDSPVPVAVGQGAVPAGTRFGQLAAGDAYSLALAADGTLYAWGYNASGQLGLNSTTNSLVPVAVTMPAATRFVQVTAGYHHSLALGADGKLYTWGQGPDGQLGNKNGLKALLPTVEYSGLTQWRSPASGPAALHSLVLGPEAALFTAGNNEYGQLGDGTTINSFVFIRSLTPLAVRPAAPAGTAAGLALWPNPAEARATAYLTGAAPGAAVQVLDGLGRLVLAAQADASGAATLALPAGLAPGVYVVRTGAQALRLTVE